MIGLNECFLEKIFFKIGFANLWIHRMMTLSTGRYRVNGNLSRVIYPSRGLGQRDLIAPYLVIFRAVVKVSIGLREAPDLLFRIKRGWGSWI